MPAAFFLYPLPLAPLWSRRRLSPGRDRNRWPRILYARRLGLHVRRTADAFAPSLALGSAVASIGCLEAGCDYGTPARVPWAVIFNDPAAAPGTPLGVPLHPTQLYTALLQFLLFVFLLWLLHRPHNDGEVLGAWLFLGGLSISLLTFLRGDGVVATQFIGAVMVLAGGLLVATPPTCSPGFPGRMKNRNYARSPFPKKPTASVSICF